MSDIKKLFLILGLLILGAALLFGKQVSRALSITTTPESSPLISPVAIDIPIDQSDPVLGNPGAPLSIIEFSDIGCGECQKTNQILMDFVNKNPEAAKLIWKDDPATSLFFKDYLDAHKAAYCAGKQKKFWPYVSKIVAEKKYRSLSDLTKAAGDLQLVTSVFETCLNDPATAQKINESRIVAKQLGIQKAPVIFVNNRRITLTKDIELPQLLQAFIAP